MHDQFIPYGIVWTEYIRPAAAASSCGARLHDYREAGEDSCVRKVIKQNGRTEIVTRFQFHEVTTKGEKVRTLFEAHKELDFGRPCNLPANHTLRITRNALAERNRLHLWFQKLIQEPIMQPLDGFGTSLTPLAATLSSLGHKIKGARRTSDRIVSFFFDDAPEIRNLAEAYQKPWGEYLFDENHPLYHMRGALENREQLIVLLKNASVRVEVNQAGKRFQLPLNASPEKLRTMIHKLNQ